jgi:integrase/recombinase XerD
MDRNRQLGELWMETLASERGMADAAHEAYSNYLDCYLGFLGARGLTLEQADQGTVDDYLAYLNPAGYADMTIVGRRAVIHGLHRFLVLEGIRKDDPTDRMAPMRRHVKPPTVVSTDEVNRLLETAHRAADDNSARLFKRASLARRSALLETLYVSGMRISEAVRLPARAARTSTRHLLIRGKGGQGAARSSTSRSAGISRSRT